MLRRRRPAARAADPDPALPARWQAPLDRAGAARTRFTALVERTPPGPLRLRLESMAAELDGAVADATATAVRAAATETTVAELDVGAVGERLKAARRRVAQLPESVPERAVAEADAALLADQFASLNRLRNGLDDAARELERLELRMETAVARAAELALGTTSVADAAQTLDGIVAELGGLRAALRELHGGPA